MCMSRFKLLCCVSVLCCVYGVSLSSASAALSAQVCSKLAAGKAYPESAQCFLRLSSKIQRATSSKVERKLKGLYMLNASKLFAKEATKLNHTVKSSFFREKAAHVLRTYLKQKLCTQTFRCQEVQGRLWKLEQQIQYGQVTLVAKGKGKLSISGYRYKREFVFPPNRSVRLRPGTYKCVVVYSTGLSTVKDITVQPKATKIVTLTPPKPRTVRIVKRIIQRPKPRPKPKAKNMSRAWVWGTLIGGGVALAAGVTLAVVGSNQAQDSRARVEKLAAKQGGLNREDIQPLDRDYATLDEEQLNILEQYDRGALLNTIGWIASGVGAAALVAGTVGFVMTMEKKVEPKFTLQKHPTRPIATVRLLSKNL